MSAVPRRVLHRKKYLGREKQQCTPTVSPDSLSLRRIVGYPRHFFFAHRVTLNRSIGCTPEKNDTKPDVNDIVEISSKRIERASDSC